jgi:catechol 2,3-dioxygenase-like lactoylglutathione lyase family enzyme
MTNADARPLVAVAHVSLDTDRMAESCEFMRTLGMRAVFEGPTVSVFELRGGTHLLLMHKAAVVHGDAPFDLMVDDLQDTHRRLTSLGFAPSAIEARPAIDHEVFILLEPAGHVLTVFSSHAACQPASAGFDDCA